MSKTVVRKFKFSDLNLAFKVRQIMWNCFVKFDYNHNQRFQPQQIKQILKNTLAQNQTQIQYVIKNVFRYDTDGDGFICYAEFTNFCVEQHFGEMAIQRLHRKQYYVNGHKRIMNFQEFETTLNYCLDKIQSKGTKSQYRKLFQEVDLDRDEYINYQDYFIFLRQYFGSQSQAFQWEQQNPRPKSQPIIQYTETAQYKIAKLIYTQFKILVMQKNRKKNLLLQKSEVQQILINILKLSHQECAQIVSKCVNSSYIKYQQFMKLALVIFMSQLKVRNIGKLRLSENQFVELMSKSCDFISVKPSEETLKSCYKQICNELPYLSINDYTNSIKNIFQNYKFDTRGLPVHLLRNN